MTVCIQYTRPASGQNEGNIFGIDVAVNAFLSAWFRYGAAEKFICRPTDMPSFEHFKALAAAAGIDTDKRCIGLHPLTPQHNMESIGCLFRPDPSIGNPLWQRAQVPGPGYAACGLIHTMSGERVARVVGELILAPAAAGDALICPSEAIRDAVRRLWDIYAEYLNYKSGGSFACPIETPVIPLGVDAASFAARATQEKRATQRQALGAAADEIVILFVGRLSFATKAHPLALWQAAERAAEKTGRRLRTVMYGYFMPPNMEKHFRALAAATGKVSKIEFVTNDDTRFPDGMWAAADIFASPSDNVQESFGLTPIEAMAAGLPVIASNWDGYRASIRDGRDGFLISTFAPPPEAGLAIAERYFNDENYGVALTGAAQSTAVDIGRCAEAIAVLATDENRRRAMGASGRAHAESTFDWKHVIRAYETLWEELAQKRRAAALRPPTPPGWPAAHPAFPNPFAVFRGFPSAVLASPDHIRIVMDRAAMEALLAHEMNFFLPELLAPKEALLELAEIVRRAGAPSCGDILAAFPAAEHARLWRCLGWMLKFGIAAREDA